MMAFANNYDHKHVCFVDKTRALQEHRFERNFPEKCATTRNNAAILVDRKCTNQTVH